MEDWQTFLGTTNFPLIEETFDAVSYYQLLSKLYAYTKEIYDNIDDIIEKQISETLDDFKATIDAEIEALTTSTEASITEFEATVNAAIESFETEVTTSINDISSRLSEAVTTLNTTINSLRTYVDAQNAVQDANLTEAVTTINQRIDNLVLDLPDIYNPVEGANTTIEQAILDLYGLHQTDALTAGEYDALELTAEAYDAYELTAYNYDLSGKSYLSA